LLKLRILPFAQKLDADSFRASYKTAAVSRCFRRHGPQLRKLFFRYATLHSVAVSSLDGARADSWTNTIDLREFVALLSHLQLMHSAKGFSLGGKEASKMLLTFDQVYAIFANVQQDLHVANAAVTSAAVVKNTPWAPSNATVSSSTSSNGAAATDNTAGKAKLSRMTSSRRKAGSKGSQGGFAPLNKRATGKNSKRLSIAGPSGAAVLSGLQASDAHASEDERSGRSGADETETEHVEEEEESDAHDGEPSAAASEAERAPSPGAEQTELDASAAAGVDSPSVVDPLLGISSDALSALTSATGPSTAHTELIFPEYLEALAAIALFRYPNPYRSTAERIALFLEQDVLPHVPRLLRRTQHAAAPEEE